MNIIEETQTSAKIRTFILASINIPNLSPDDNLFESGIVNSLFAVEFMTFLEKEFKIEVTMDDLDIANFQSITAASKFVARKKPQPLVV